MRLRVNGEPKTVRDESSVAALLEELHLGVAAVVVERNGVIVPRHQQETTVLREGDVLEVVRLVGGG